jgi:hypothetical protein
LFHQGVSKPTAVYKWSKIDCKAKLSDKTVLFVPKKKWLLANSTSTATKTWHYKLKMLGICLGLLQRHLF